MNSEHPLPGVKTLGPFNSGTGEVSPFTSNKGTALKKLTTQTPPSLSTAATAWWIKLTAEYQLEDAAGLLLLETALQAFDRMHEARALIAEHGAVTLDRFQQLRPNPATTIERDSRAAMLAGLKALNLDIEPLRDGAGRPPGR